jgi:hypothetical protein
MAHFPFIGGVKEHFSFLGEPSNVTSETLPTLLGTPLEVPGAPKAFVGALDVSNKGLPKVSPFVDGVTWQVLKLGPHPFREVDREELDGEMVIFYSHHASSKVVILQPDTGI